MVDGSWKGAIIAIDGSWKGVMELGRDATYECQIADCRAMGCRVVAWWGTVVWRYGCVFMVLLRAVVNGHWCLAVGQLQNLVL